MPHQDAAAGMSLLESLVTVALVGIVCLAAAGLMKVRVGAETSVRARGKDSDLRDYVRNSISCEATFATTAVLDQCSRPGGSALTVRGQDGKALIGRGSRSTVVFANQLRATCQDLGGFFGIDVEYLPLSKSGRARIDGMTGEPATWKNLFLDIPFACPADCDLRSEFVDDPDKDWIQPPWLSMASSCPAFRLGGGTARAICGDNLGRQLQPARPQCTPRSEAVKIHIEAKVTTRRWADGFPLVGVFIGRDYSDALWFSLLSDSVAGTQSTPATLHPLIVDTWGTPPRASAPLTVLPDREYHLIVDVQAGVQSFTIKDAAGDVVALMSARSAFKLSGKPVNFMCGEAQCEFRDLIVQVQPAN